MGAFLSKQVARRKALAAERCRLGDTLVSAGAAFPGADYRPADRKKWMSDLAPLDRVRLHDVVFPGTHDSATNKIGVRFITRPFAQCQKFSVYRQLALGVRVLDIRVNERRRVCHGILSSYSVDVVLRDIKRFLQETESEILIAEFRTEFGHEDPPEFDSYLIGQLGEFLIHHDEAIFDRTIAELLPKRVICVWKPRKAAAPSPGGALWSGGYIRDNWIDTDLPETKFESNMRFLSEQPAAAARRYFYRVENTVTPQADNPVLCVKPVARRIHGYARMFIAQAFARGFGDRLQVFSTDFVDEDFVDACAGATHGRIEPNCAKP